MKSVALKLFMVTVLSVFAFSLFAAPKDKPQLIVLRPAVKVQDVSEPKASFSSSLPIPQTGKTNYNKWMMVLVDFTVGLRELNKQSRKLFPNAPVLKAGSSRDWLDNVDVSVKGMFETMNGYSEQHVLFSGVTKLYSLRLNHSRHLVLFFLPPHIIDRYYIPHPVKSSNAKPKSDGKEKEKVFRYHKLNQRDMMIEVVISADGVELARKYLNVKLEKEEEKMASGKNREELLAVLYQKKFSMLGSKVPGNYNLDGALLSKGQSPWAYYKYDQFDLEKKNH